MNLLGHKWSKEQFLCVSGWKIIWIGCLNQHPRSLSPGCLSALQKQGRPKLHFPEPLVPGFLGASQGDLIRNSCVRLLAWEHGSEAEHTSLSFCLFPVDKPGGGDVLCRSVPGLLPSFGGLSGSCGSIDGVFLSSELPLFLQSSQYLCKHLSPCNSLAPTWYT